MHTLGMRSDDKTLF